MYELSTEMELNFDYIPCLMGLIRCQSEPKWHHEDLKIEYNVGIYQKCSYYIKLWKFFKCDNVN